MELVAFVLTVSLWLLLDPWAMVPAVIHSCLMSRPKVVVACAVVHSALLVAFRHYDNSWFPVSAAVPITIGLTCLICFAGATALRDERRGGYSP